MKWLRGAWNWFDQRVGFSKKILGVMRHPVPPGATSKKSGWMYVLGFATLFMFLLQGVSGITLATKYVPAPAHAYESILFISNEVFFGHFVRGLHFYGASAMVVLVLLHMARVFLTGSYKFPREMNWLSGVVLLFLTLALAYTGQMLRWDENGVWTVVVFTQFVGRVPLIGPWLAEFVLAGDTVGGATLSRFFAFHALILPALLIGFVGLHLYLVLHHGISEPPRAGHPVVPATYQENYEKMLEEKGKPYWPDAVWKEAIFSFGVLVVVALLAFLVGPRAMGMPPDPTILTANPKPDWYFLWYYALVEVKPRALDDVVMVYMPMAVGLALLALPFLRNRGERSPARRPWAVALVGVVAVFFVWLTVLGIRAPWVPDFSTQPLPPEVVGPADSLEYRGALLFYANGCQFCHAVVGEGGDNAPDLTNVARRLPSHEITFRIFNGIGNMPAYRDILTPEEMHAIVAFLVAIEEVDPGR